MSSLDTAARGGAFTLFLLLGLLLLLREGRNAPPGRVGGLLSLSAAVYVIESAPAFAALTPAEAPWRVPLQLVGMGLPALFWLFSAASFDDSFRLSWRHSLPWLASVGLGAVCLLGPWPRLWLLHTALILALVVLACWQAAAGRSADLIEGRRRFRLLIIGLIAAHAIVVIIANLSTGDAGQRLSSSLANAVSLLAIGFLVSVTRLVIRNETPQILPASTMLTAATPAVTPISVHSPTSPALNPTQDEVDETESSALLGRLQALMAEQRVYREEGLTIAALAERMAIPQYRLRRLINQRLGHRNFSTFVNGYRLAEAMAALADPGQVDVPILTIALDTGFQSIGPFNRAFKAHTGMTPTDYRRAHQGMSDPNTSA